MKWTFVVWFDLTSDDLHAVHCLRSFLWGAAAHSKINNLNLGRRNFNRTLWTLKRMSNFFREWLGVFIRHRGEIEQWNILFIFNLSFSDNRFKMDVICPTDFRLDSGIRILLDGKKNLFGWQLVKTSIMSLHAKLIVGLQIWTVLPFSHLYM